MENQNQTFANYQKYLLFSFLHEDDGIASYLKQSTNPTEIKHLYALHQTIKNKKMMIQLVKTLIRSTMINAKKFISTTNNKILKPILEMVTPENIETNITADEYLILVNSVVEKKELSITNNLYLQVAFNILTSLISVNMESILNNFKKLNDNEVNVLYNKFKTMEQSDEQMEIEENNNWETVSRSEQHDNLSEHHDSEHHDSLSGHHDSSLSEQHDSLSEHNLSEQHDNVSEQHDVSEHMSDDSSVRDLNEYELSEKEMNAQDEKDLENETIFNNMSTIEELSEPECDKEIDFSERGITKDIFKKNSEDSYDDSLITDNQSKISKLLAEYKNKTFHMQPNNVTQPKTITYT